MPATPILLLMAARGETGVEPLPPELATVFAFEQVEPNCDSLDGWTVRITWTVTNPNNDLYYIRIDMTAADGGSDYINPVATDLPCANGFYDDKTGIQGNPLQSDHARYRRYLVRIMRRSDDSETDRAETLQVSTSFGDCL